MHNALFQYYIRSVDEVKAGNEKKVYTTSKDIPLVENSINIIILWQSSKDQVNRLGRGL